MCSLSDTQLDMIQKFLDMHVARYRHFGMHVNLCNDLQKWKKFAETSPGTGGVTGALDPDLNDLHKGNSFWVYLTDNDGEIVTCVVYRFMETEDFVRDWIATQRLFGDATPRLHQKMMTLNWDAPKLKKRIVFAGGNWVHPKMRGRSMLVAFNRLSRIIAQRHFLFDYFTGFLRSVTDVRYSAKNLGFSGKIMVSTGHYAGRDHEIDVDMVWVSQADILASTAFQLEEASKGSLSKRTA